MYKLLFIAFLITASFAKAQVLLNESQNKYLQNFGTSDITTWNNNSTFVGWYASIAIGTHQSISAAAPTNTGGFYSYECSGDNNQKIGSRPSGTTGTIYYGLRIQNNSPRLIKSLEISYDYFQFSLAENDGNLNTIAFSYQVKGGVISDLTSGTYSNYAALNFSQKVGDTGGTSNQLNGYPCTQSGAVSSCLAIDIPAGSEIMLRWTDINDAANDHHMGIDNVSILAHESNICDKPLPVSLMSFNITENENKMVATWITRSEINNSHFELQSSSDGVNFEFIEKIQGKGNALGKNEYVLEIAKPNNISYYRLKQVDFNGNYTYSSIVGFTPDEIIINPQVQIIPNPSEGSGTIMLNVNNSQNIDYNLFNSFGQVIKLENARINDNLSVLELNYNNLPSGIYYFVLRNGQENINKILLVR